MSNRLACTLALFIALVAPVALPARAATIAEGVAAPYPAPTITGIASWINSEPLTTEALRGKVVLVDFWTYTCINCIRTLPYLKAWDAKYRDQGLVIIGMHSPEFAFEKEPKNVAQAVKRFGIHYPVALDSDMATWAAFKNNYWPAHYLIDRQGNVVYTHFGEGKYDVTERNIQALLETAGAIEGKPAAIASRDQSPETYLGTNRAENFASPEGLPGPLASETRAYSFPDQLTINQWALSGHWTAAPDRIALQADDGALRYAFTAGKVFLVMSPPVTGAAKVKVLLDGKPVTTNAGHDVAAGIVTVDSQRLYELLDFKGKPQSGLLELQPQTAGVQLYAFTFGL